MRKLMEDISGENWQTEQVVHGTRVIMRMLFNQQLSMAVEVNN